MIPDVRSLSQSLRLHSPNICALSDELWSHLRQHLLDARLPHAQRRGDFLFRRLVAAAKRGGLLDRLPLGDGLGGLEVRAVDAGGDQVE